MTETTTVVEAVDEAVETVDEGPIIDEEVLRSLALKLNPFVKIGESPPMNLARRDGWPTSLHRPRRLPSLAQRRSLRCGEGTFSLACRPSQRADSAESATGGMLLAETAEDMRRLLLLLGLVLTSLVAAVPVASATTEPPSTEAPLADEDVVEEVVVDTDVPTTETTEVPPTTEPSATEVATTEAPTTEVSTTEIPATTIEAPTTTVAARATAVETAAVVAAAAALPYSVTVAEGCVDHGFGDEPVVNFTNTGTGTIVAAVGMAVRNVAPGGTFEAWWPSAHGDLYPQFDWEAYELPDPMGEWGPVFATGTVYLANACRVTTVPTAPRSLAAAPGASGQVKLTWLVPLSDGGSTLTDYIVQRSTNATSGWTTIADGVRATTGLHRDWSHQWHPLLLPGAGQERRWQLSWLPTSPTTFHERFRPLHGR